MISKYTTKGDQQNLSIKYENVYSINGEICYLTIEKNNDPPYVNKFTNQYSFRPKIVFFDTQEDIANYVNSFSNIQEIELAAIGDNLWYGNIGHALWDGLYPLYVALVKFGYIHNDFVVLFGGFQNKQTLAYEPTVRFTGNDILDYYELDKNKIIHFKILIAGTGSTGNRVINKDYTLYGEKEYQAVSYFKQRLLSRYELKYDNPINSKLKAIIIKNKRYCEKEIESINKIVDYYKEILDIRYIDWYHEYTSFEQQMKEIVDVDIHITGPGTGMMYMPFLKKGAVNINLGYIEHIQTNTARPNLKIEGLDNDALIIPGWMEQSVCAGANYVNTIYYDRFTNNYIEFESLNLLIEKAIKKVNNIQQNNWNIDAIVFKEYCKRCKNPEQLCEYLTGIAFFIELFVNEHPKTYETGLVDIDLLRSIKNELNYNRRYEIKV
jgi:hypothetical protein